MAQHDNGARWKRFEQIDDRYRAKLKKITEDIASWFEPDYEQDDRRASCGDAQAKWNKPPEKDYIWERDLWEAYADDIADGVNDLDGHTAQSKSDNRGPYSGFGPKGFRQNPERLREKISERLANHSWVNAAEIDVEISGNEVILSGRVPSRKQKRLAEDCVETVPGIADIHNRLVIDESLSHTSTADHEPPGTG